MILIYMHEVCINLYNQKKIKERKIGRRAHLVFDWGIIFSQDH